MEALAVTARLVLSALGEDDLDDLVARDGPDEIRRFADPLHTQIPVDAQVRRAYERATFLNGGR